MKGMLKGIFEWNIFLEKIDFLKKTMPFKWSG